MDVGAVVGIDIIITVFLIDIIFSSRPAGIAEGGQRRGGGAHRRGRGGERRVVESRSADPEARAASAVKDAFREEPQ